MHTYSLISHPLFLKYPLQHNGLFSYQTPKILASIPWGDLHNLVRTLTSTLKNLKFILGGSHKTLVWPLTSTSKISTPSLGKTFTKPGMASTSTQNIDPILGRLHRTLPISTTFSNIEPVSLTLLWIQRYMNIYSTTYHCCPDPFGARIKFYVKSLCVTLTPTSYYKM